MLVTHNVETKYQLQVHIFADMTLKHFYVPVYVPW